MIKAMFYLHFNIFWLNNILFWLFRDSFLSLRLRFDWAFRFLRWFWRRFWGRYWCWGILFGNLFRWFRLWLFRIFRDGHLLILNLDGFSNHNLVLCSSCWLCFSFRLLLWNFLFYRDFLFHWLSLFSWSFRGMSNFIGFNLLYTEGGFDFRAFHAFSEDFVVLLWIYLN